MIAAVSGHLVMNRALFFLICVLAAFSFAACSSEGSPDGNAVQVGNGEAGSNPNAEIPSEFVSAGDALAAGNQLLDQGETAKAMVVRAPDSDVTEADIIAYAKERLATFKCPTTVEWLDVLPRNPSGKVLKKDLREPFWEGRERRVG